MIGPDFATGASGSLQSGRFHGRMIVVENLMDQDAFPWQADWYASKVKAVLGDQFDNRFRLWYTERAVHGDQERSNFPTYTVSYLGVLHQALRDISAWVEKGVAPPPSTSYSVVDGQVQVPAKATERKGIQPLIQLTANGKARAEVRVNDAVRFNADIEAPPNTGQIVAAEWDFEGEGTFSAPAQLAGASRARAAVTATHAFSKPGTYFVTLRAASQREGDAQTPFARIQNLSRVRVVVR